MALMMMLIFILIRFALHRLDEYREKGRTVADSTPESVANPSYRLRITRTAIIIESAWVQSFGK